MITYIIQCQNLYLKPFHAIIKKCIIIYGIKYQNIIIVHIKVKLYERK
jgi:hypothetical protein